MWNVNWEKRSFSRKGYLSLILNYIFALPAASLLDKNFKFLVKKASYLRSISGGTFKFTDFAVNQVTWEKEWIKFVRCVDYFGYEKCLCMEPDCLVV